ncbi:hypothetical protein [Salinimicrobium terrae]|uniref:hypothetical protein n=1 Tax=Salinimicrobium terrae TaxID=470866 RepID=UPI00041CE211|nr:hypothetical protein [Salinimicrobium terrae]
MRKLFTALFLLFISIPLVAQDITGDWYGNLKVQDRNMGIVFHISETHDGYITTLDSPAQNAYDIPVESITYNDRILEVKAPKAGGFHFKGKLTDKGLSGSLRQGGALVPLKLYREKPEEAKKE